MTDFIEDAEFIVAYKNHDKRMREIEENNTNITKSLDTIDAIDAINYVRQISKLHDCNDCKDRDCKYRPKLGEAVRINCFAWKG